MPGLVGFVGDQPPETTKLLLDTMAKELMHEPWYKVQLHHGEGFGIGRVSLGLSNPEPQPIWSEDKNLCLVMEGEIFGYEDLKQGLIAKGYNFKQDNDADFVLHLYQDVGDKFPSFLNGAFVVAICVLREHKLILANDRFGLRPLYYALNNKNLFFSSGLRALSSCSLMNWSINPLAIAQLLSFEYPLGNQTLLAEAHLLPPATLLTFKAGQLRSRSYWSLEFNEVNQSLKEVEYVEKFFYYMNLAVERQANDDLPNGILLSGGLDSRLLLGFLSDILDPRQLHSLTFGAENSDDVRLARRLAARTGTQHHFYKLNSDYLIEAGEEGVRLTGGMMSCVHMHSYANIRAQSKIAKVIFKGYLGDALLGGHLDRELWARYDEDALSQLLFKKHCVLFQLEEQQRLFTDHFRRLIQDDLMESFRQAVKESKAMLPANIQNHFDLHQRQRRFILNGVELVRSQVIVRTPFCDNDLVDFMLTVPPGLRLDRFLVIQTLINHFPDLAKVPFARSGFPLMECAEDLILRFNQLLQWHLHRIGWRRSPHPQRRPYANYNRWMRTSLRTWMEELLLSKHSLERGYFNPNYIRNLIDEHMNGADHALKLGMLITLELWHRQFLD